MVDFSTHSKNWVAPGHTPGSNFGKEAGDRRGILVIDDSPLFQRVLVDILESADYPVIGVASCGQSGADLALALKPRVIILDHNMPKCKGLECLGLVRREDNDARIIVCSANLTLDLSREYLAQGADDFLAKPISLRTLFNLLDRYYHNQSPRREPSPGNHGKSVPMHKAKTHAGAVRPKRR